MFCAVPFVARVYKYAINTSKNRLMTVLLNLRWHYKKDGNSLICTLGVQEISILVEYYTHRITLQEKKQATLVYEKL